ncbi:MAG: hypothetical protein CNCCGFBP_00979 [Fimbriimonadaceae bacterium]|nr:hypothetical protein [Fimbriimonadaceae bacterium]RIJ98651.1 MAG: YraN family protein [Armatimonadota bacterium]
MPNLRRVGREAEDRAAAYLESLGYTVIARRFQARHGEIDLVALDGATMVFVEVKMRRDAEAHPEDAVNRTKKMRIVESAREFLEAYEGPDVEVRFDVVTVASGRLTHLPDAFWPED